MQVLKSHKMNSAICWAAVKSLNWFGVFFCLLKTGLLMSQNQLRIYSEDPLTMQCVGVRPWNCCSRCFSIQRIQHRCQKKQKTARCTIILAHWSYISVCLLLISRKKPQCCPFPDNRRIEGLISISAHMQVNASALRCRIDCTKNTDGVLLFTPTL